MGKFYKVIKRIRGRAYIYMQSTYRGDDGKVKTISRYVGPASGESHHAQTRDEHRDHLRKLELYEAIHCFYNPPQPEPEEEEPEYTDEEKKEIANAKRAHTRELKQYKKQHKKLIRAAHRRLNGTQRVNPFIGTLFSKPKK